MKMEMKLFQFVVRAVKLIKNKTFAAPVYRSIVFVHGLDISFTWYILFIYDVFYIYIPLSLILQHRNMPYFDLWVAGK